MKNLISRLLQNFSTISFYVILAIVILLILMVIISYFIDQTEDKNMFDMTNMTEDEKKLHLFTLLNTKINREHNGNTDYYVNEVYKRIYGTNYKQPPVTRKREKNIKKKVSFNERPIIMNEAEFF